MIDFLLSALVLFITIPVLFLVVQLFSARIGPPDSLDETNVDLSNVVVLVPAHNEESIIETTLESLIAELPSSGQVLVVADNCVDATASVARQCGAQVIERKHETDKGKGFALEFGMQHLQKQTNCPEYIVILDADCLLEPKSLKTLITSCVAARRPVQALNLMSSKNNTSARTKIAEFAWVIKNRVRPMGSMRWGLPCQLMGTGMAFPFELLSKLKLGSPHLVEDMKLGIDCAQKGFPPVFCPGALVESNFPEDDFGLKSQRTRWEHGHLGMIFSEALGFLKSAIVSKQKINLAMAFDLMIPPLAFLVLILLFLITVLLMVFWLFDVGLVALTILSSILFLLAIGLLVSWYRFARNIISIRELLWVPVYIVAKIPLYLRYWTRRQIEWIRTDRE